MDVGAMVRRLIGRLRPPPRGPRGPRPRGRGESTEQRAARRYWDEQVADDHARRGVNDKHA